MNYIILNGKRSDSITGLLIQRLPSISKPLIRTEVEEIDGRDGDIVTPLGYSAYDKEITIGLYGDYDIDKVISYFDSSGTVILSNEPDKYYLYQIIEQIDFERLIRYRTATVTLHVQPYKYSAIEGKYDLDNQWLSIPTYSAEVGGIEVSASGSEVSFSGTDEDGVNIMIPINPMVLEQGTYTLKAVSSGSGKAMVGLLKNAPSRSQAFGEQFPMAISGKTVTVEAETSGTYRYIWIYVNGTVNLTIDFTVASQFVDLYNEGNTKSKPIIIIYGSGDIAFSVNGGTPFEITMPSESIKLDVAQMNAFVGDAFANRSVYGDYDDLNLAVGANRISWTGKIDKIVWQRYSRWI